MSLQRVDYFLITHISEKPNKLTVPTLTNAKPDTFYQLETKHKEVIHIPQQNVNLATPRYKRTCNKKLSHI